MIVCQKGNSNRICMSLPLLAKAEASGMSEDTRCVFAVSADTHTVGPVLDMRNCLDPVSITFLFVFCFQ